MLYTQAEIEAVKRSVDLVSRIRSSGVELKKKGKDFVGRCPFHEDKSPSLLVSAEKGLWNCLGACGTGGTPWGRGFGRLGRRNRSRPRWPGRAVQ